MLNQYDQKQSIQKKLDNFKHACKNAGLKLTHQRLEIYRELAMASDHPAAETIHKRLKERMPTISLDTIYRTLMTLENHGLIRKVQTVESQARYEAEMIQHHHLICDKCKKIMDFQWKTFDESTLPDEISAWGRIQYKNVVLHGICDKCLQKK
ncbi:MAG: transcriptional repressor [Deltaproteobacteria bacterium]|nr:transcriptional repressor [Deltaproteobacteria bacterium]